MTEMGRRSGDMNKSTYDADANGVVDDSEKLDGSTKAEVQDHTPKTHTHTEAQITDLDHDAQKIKGVSVDDAAIADGKVLTYQSASGKIEYITPAPSGAVLDNIQFCEITVANGSATGDCTITAVDTDKTILIPAGQQYSNTVDSGAFTVILLNSTTVRAQRNGTSTDREVKVFVLEFSSGINSVQRGIEQLSAVATKDVDITAVDLDKSFVTYTGARNVNASWNDVPCRVKFKDSDTITIVRNTTTGSIYCSYEVVEFE